MAAGPARMPRALALVLALYAILWTCGYVLSANPWVYQLYHLNFETSTAHRLARALAKTQLAGDGTCLLLGPSTVKEGFDTRVMEETTPGIRWVNGGTAGGTIWILSAVNEMVLQSRVQPRCIVLGINGRMLVTRKIGLNQHGYTDFLDLGNGRELLAQEVDEHWEGAYDQLVTNTIWPYHRPARQLGRLVRLGGSHLRFLTTGPNNPLSDEDRPLDLVRSEFELAEDELKLASRFRWHAKRSLPPDHQRSLEVFYEREGLLDPQRVARPEHLETLRVILEDLLAASHHLIVIRMPERSYGREHFQPLSAAALEPLLADFEARGACVLDRTAYFPDEALRDMGHLTIPAREIFSKNMAVEFRNCLESTNGNS